MVSIQCPYCKNNWDFQGKPRGLKHKVRCSKANCRKWFEMSKEMVSSNKSSIIHSRYGLDFDLCSHGIMNRGRNVEKPINSEVEILLKIINPTKETIGISRIMVNSKEKGYPIAISMEDSEERKTINSIRLEPQEAKMIRLFDTKNPITKDNYYIEADIEVYDMNSKIIKSIPIKLYISYASL